LAPALCGQKARPFLGGGLFARRGDALFAPPSARHPSPSLTCFARDSSSLMDSVTSTPFSSATLRTYEGERGEGRRRVSRGVGGRRRGAPPGSNVWLAASGRGRGADRAMRPGQRAKLRPSLAPSLWTPTVSLGWEGGAGAGQGAHGPGEAVACSVRPLALPPPAREGAALSSAPRPGALPQRDPSLLPQVHAIPPRLLLPSPLRLLPPGCGYRVPRAASQSQAP